MNTSNSYIKMEISFFRISFCFVHFKFTFNGNKVSPKSECYAESVFGPYNYTLNSKRNAPPICIYYKKKKRKRSDSILWQKPLHQQKCQKGKVTTQPTPQKSSIKPRLRTDLGRSVGVTTATQLVWLTGLRAHLPTNRNSRLIKRTHV